MFFCTYHVTDIWFISGDFKNDLNRSIHCSQSCLEERKKNPNFAGEDILECNSECLGMYFKLIDFHISIENFKLCSLN